MCHSSWFLISFDRLFGSLYFQGGIGHWAVYYLSPQSFIIMFSYSLTEQLLLYKHHVIFHFRIMLDVIPTLQNVTVEHPVFLNHTDVLINSTANVLLNSTNNVLNGTNFDKGILIIK